MDQNLTPSQKALLTKRLNKEAAEAKLQECPVITETPKQPVNLKECEKAFSIGKGEGGWYFTTTYIKGDKLIMQDKVGPTMRAVVVDEFKIEVQRHIERME